MFESSSRYASCVEATIEIDSGTYRRQVRYIKRRILPKGEEMSVSQEVTVRAGDRLDLISYHLLGDPQLYWQICDTNNTMYPPELTNQLGKVLRIPSPWS